MRVTIEFVPDPETFGDDDEWAGDPDEFVIDAIRDDIHSHLDAAAWTIEREHRDDA